MEFLRKNTALTLLGAVVLIGTYAAGVHHGKASSPASAGLANTAEGEPSSVDFAPFWKAWNIINEKYISASTTAPQVTDQDKVYGAIEGLAASLGDPYTVFFPPADNEIFQTDIRGNFEGVGMEVQAENGAITVIAPLKGSPAAAAGIKPGDHIIKIGDESTANMATEDAVQKIRGKDGTSVSLTLVRNGVKDPITLSIKRAVIDLPTIDTQRLENGIFRISLYSFSENSPNLFRSALREFVLSGDHKLILDLRGNPGGYLEAAIDMASWFLPSSKVVVREDYSGSQPETVYRSRGYDIFNDNLKMVILVDKGSASASEILAGALKEQGVAELVGDTTFGKGSVQELVDITSDTSLKVTVARWLTPNGVSISQKGIEPNYKVPYTQADKAAGRDPQLEKAIEILNAEE
jgi:carboxyl-terminal processing protease